jgi:hypothetical protein
VPAKHKVTLAELRELAREALGDGATVRETQYDGHLAIARIPALVEVTAVSASSMAARRQLRDLLERIIAGQNAGEGCTLHADAPHGKEAEELRSGIEQIIARSNAYVSDVHADLRTLLDQVNARDSLAHLRAKERAPRRRATNGAGYRRERA